LEFAALASGEIEHSNPYFLWIDTKIFHYIASFRFKTDQ
jgi:hypothetical protein